MPPAKRDRRPIIWVPLDGVQHVMASNAWDWGPCSDGLRAFLDVCEVRAVSRLTVDILQRALAVADERIFAPHTWWFLCRLPTMGGHVGSTSSPTEAWRDRLMTAARKGGEWQDREPLCANVSKRYRIFFYAGKKIKPEQAPVARAEEKRTDEAE